MTTVEELLKLTPDRHAPVLPSEPDLGIEHGGRQLTAAETARLLRNCLRGRVKEIDLSAEGRRKLAECLLDWQEAGVFFPAYRHIVFRTALDWGDASTVLRMEQQLADDPYIPIGFAAALARAKGAAALLWLRDRVNRLAVMSPAKEFEALRGTVIRAAVFDLLVKPQPKVQWPALQQDGFRFTAEEFRACAADGEQAAFLAGTVLEFRSANGAVRFAPFPAEPLDGETVAVAHPATTPEAERRPGARFNQWSLGTPGVDWRGREVSPVRLLLQLEERGWRRGATGGDAVLRCHRRTFAELGVEAVVEYDGVPLAGGEWRKQRLRDVRYEGGAHPIAVAAVERDLAELAKCSN